MCPFNTDTWDGDGIYVRTLHCTINKGKHIHVVMDVDIHMFSMSLASLRCSLVKK